MLLVLLTIVVVTCITYLYLRPLIDNLLYSVPHQPKYVHSYIPLIGFGLRLAKDPIDFVRSFYMKYGKTFVISMASKRWVYMYDEQTYLTKVLKSSELSIEEFLVDFTVAGLNTSRQCVANEDIQQIQLKQYHHYLVGKELEVLNKRVHDSLKRSISNDAKSMQNDRTKVVNFFDFFGELMLYAGCEGLFGKTFTDEQRNATPNFYRLFEDFDESIRLNVFCIPFRTLLHKSLYDNRRTFIKRFYSLKRNNGESNLIHAREELYRSDQYKHLFTEYDIAALQAAFLWAAVANTAPMGCWSLMDLFLHPEAFAAVKRELEENIPASSAASVYDKETLAKLKILESCIHDTIRRVSNGISTRQAMTNTTIECSDKSKIGLRKGDMLIYPTFLKHFDPDLFGPNPYEYQYDRYVKRPHHSKVPSVMLFGCGPHTCPGRYWAINEIKIYVALVIQHMNIEFINITEQDKADFRKKLPYDYTKIVSSGGPKKVHKHKFDIKYSYKNTNID